ncbi:MAG: hypothetical protein MK538_10475 [Planctomycetes bacterium]|nr:hypothetical protein [Planctomycetota bacterium]
MITHGVRQRLTIRDCAAYILQQGFQAFASRRPNQRVERTKKGNTGTKKIGELTIHDPKFASPDAPVSHRARRGCLIDDLDGEEALFLERTKDGCFTLRLDHPGNFFS